jgi:Flp pilus assembly protein TadG
MIRSAIPAHRRSPPASGKRRGTAVVEFAVVAIVLGVVVAGMVELGRGMAVKSILTDAGREGANTGITANKTYTDIWNAVDKILSANQLPATLSNGKAQLTVSVAVWDAKKQTYRRDVVVDAKTFAPNQYDKVSVQVTVNAADVSWLYLNYTNGQVESETVTMMKQ